MQNCSKSIENYCFKHKNLIGSGVFAPDLPPGAPPQSSDIVSRSRTRHVCIIKNP